jgi:hypothetical protein
MPKYTSNVKIEYRPLTPDMLFYQDRAHLRKMGSCYQPDESISFYDNLVLKYKYDLRKTALEQILEIKRAFYSETGEEL